MFENKIKKSGGGKSLLVLILAFGLWGCFDSGSSKQTFSCFEYGDDETEITGYKDKDSDDNACSKDVVIPDEITSIAEGAFQDKGLTSVEIPESVADIGANAFAGNSNLGQIYIPNPNTSVGTDAFPNGYDLEGVMACFEFDSTNTNQINDYYDNENNDSNNPACSRDVEIPHGVTSIGDEAFKDKLLTSVIIPNGVISIRSNAFNANTLTSVIIPDSVTTIGDSAFNTNTLTSVIIGSGITDIGVLAFFANHNLTSICIEREAAGLSLGTFAFSITPTYESDGDCSD